MANVDIEHSSAGERETLRETIITRWRQHIFTSIHDALARGEWAVDVPRPRLSAALVASILPDFVLVDGVSATDVDALRAALADAGDTVRVEWTLGTIRERLVRTDDGRYDWIFSSSDGGGSIH